MPHSKAEDATISFEVSKDFTGIMHGEANDESEGCTLTGNFIVDVHRPLKVRRLMVYFEGRCKVNLKRSSTYNMVSTPEISESRSLFSRQQHFMGQDGQLNTLQPGKHSFPFEFELPSHLPASFQGKRGYIRYRLTGAIYRPMFSHDLRTCTDVVIKRSLMDDLTPISHDHRFVETVYGKKHTQKLRYSATAPTMAYREGGLVKLNVAMQLLHPDLHQVKSVTCALRERVQYRTTDSQQQTLFQRSDDLFPLGYSTFYPDQDPDYDPTKYQDYNAIFRLIPRVNADTNSRLVKVTHSLVVNIILEKLNDGQDDPFDSYELENDDQQQQPSSSSSTYHAGGNDSDFQTWANDDHVDDKTRLQQQLQSPQQSQQQNDGYFSLSATSNNNNNNNNNNNHPSISTPTSPLLSPSATMTPPYSRTTSPTTSRANSPTLSRSSSSSSIASIFSLKHIHDDLLKLENKANKQQHHHHHHHKQQTTCTLEIPLVVTSREHAWDGHMPSPPSYRTTTSEAPPGYNQSIEQLPPVPNYQQPDSQNNNNNNNMESTSVAAV